MRPLKEKISITVDSDIVKKLKELAEADDRSFSQYINMVLKDHVQSTSVNEKDNNDQKYPEHNSGYFLLQSVSYKN